MNTVPYLGSYGYVAPSAPKFSFFERIFRSPVFWIGFLLLVIGGIIFYLNRRRRKENTAKTSFSKYKANPLDRNDENDPFSDGWGWNADR